MKILDSSIRWSAARATSQSNVNGNNIIGSIVRAASSAATSSVAASSLLSEVRSSTSSCTSERGLVSLCERPVFALNRQHVITLWEGLDVPCTGPPWQESADGIERVDRAASARQDDMAESDRPAGSILVGSHIHQVLTASHLSLRAP